MKTQAVIFPFDLFGSGGTAAGARLLGDMLREIVDDTALEEKPVRQKAFADSLTVDEFAFEDFNELTIWKEAGCGALLRSLRISDFSLWISGNHLGCLPIYETLDDTLILQFDAHLDCYDLHDTLTSLSNGNFLRGVKRKIINIGHRDLFLKSKEIHKTFTNVFSAETIAVDEASVLAAIRKRVAAAKSVWIDIDIDVFDPSIVPAVHQPLPCGLTGPQFLRFVHAIGVEKLRGVSLSEFDPGRDEKDRSLEFCGWLLEWLLLKKYNG